MPEGKRILVLIERGFNRQEYWVPTDMLREAGHEVIVASREAGRVPSRLDGEPHKRDTEAAIAMRDIETIANLDALFIPGGYSPGFLESDPDALRLVRAFMDANMPVAAICHGPRLLMATGNFEGRVGTMLKTVPSEKPEWWRTGRAAAYLDQAVVIDGNLITARYPNDAKPLGQAILDMIEGREEAPIPSGPEAVYFALWPGFDEAVVLALGPQLEAMGLEVGIVAPEKGWVRGLHGYPLPVDTTYDALPEAGMVIAPGGLWPKPGPARQGEVAEWVEAWEPVLATRKDWIRSTWESGGNVLLAGLDSELIARWEVLKDKKVASSAQLEWAFGKGGAKWTRDPLVETAPGLWTASGAAALSGILTEVLPTMAVDSGSSPGNDSGQ